jgi:hypothetical protein
MNPVHILTPYFFKTHFSTMLPSMPRYPKWSHPKMVYAFLDFPTHATSPAHLILDFVTLIIAQLV